MSGKIAIIVALVAFASAQPVEYKHHDEDAPAKYDFDYSVHDTQTGDIKQQHEVRDGDNVQGSYSLVDADGLHRIVDYTADEHNGFQATVRREHLTKPLEPIHKVAPVQHYAPAPFVHHAPAQVLYAPAPVVHHSPAPVHYAPVQVVHHTTTSAPVVHTAPVHHAPAPVHFVPEPVQYVPKPFHHVAAATHTTPAPYAQSPVYHHAGPVAQVQPINHAANYKY